MTIDEKIAKEKANAEKLRKIIETGYYGEISIEALFCDDTFAIKEAYERFENCAKEHEQLAEWLEDYKQIKMLVPTEQALKTEYNKGYSKAENDYYAKSEKDRQSSYDCGYNVGYTEALDDFVRFAKTLPIVEEEDGTIRPMWLEEMAEKLKAGVVE